MNPERWASVQRLFHEVLERPLEARATYLAEVEKADPQAAEEVRALLSAGRRAADDVFGSATSTGGPTRLAAGTRLGPYEIVSLAGAGGMGEVYKATDTRLDRTVAVKVLPADFAGDASRRSRFEREARAISHLNHPHICALHDVGEQDGVSYLVMEHLEGETLAARLARGPLPVEEATRAAIEIAEALDEAHRHRIVHRDLKPENVFLTSEGRVKVLDFGLAREDAPAVSGADSRTVSRPTEPGTVLGTVGYMSPEQVRGQPADHRSDIFSLGAVLYEMLSGRRAFQRDTAAETMTAILKDDPPALAESGRVLPPDLDRIVRHCLEKNPDKRFQSARDLAFDLRAVGGRVTGAAAISPARAWSRRAILAGGAALGLIALATVLLLRDRSRESVRPGTVAGDRKSIAVLPFENLSPDPENAFFADGITEDILTQVAKIRDLKVIARTSVMRYKGTRKPIREIASELGVVTVLEGSVRRAGNRVRIVSQLIDAATEEHLWAETYDRDLQDVFAIQSDVAQRIAVALQTKLSATEKERIEERPTRSLEAYDLYLKGRELYFRLGKADNEQAIELFQKALQLDPTFALAHAGLADAFAQRALRFGFPPLWLDSSIEAARKALSLNPRLAEGHKALGLAYVVQGRVQEALEADRRAVELNPSVVAAAGNLGTALFLLGRFDEALTGLRRAVEIDPSNPLIWAESLGPVYDALGDERAAEVAFRRASEISPDLSSLSRRLIAFHLNGGRKREALEQARGRAVAATTDARLLIAAAAAELVAGEAARARGLLERALPALQGQRPPGLYDGGLETYLAYLHLRAGRRSEAERLLEASLETDRRQLAAGNELWTVPFDMACAYALRGEKDEAFRWLEKAIEAGWRGWPNAKWTPLLDPLRSDERFQKLMARLDAMLSEMRRKAGL
jgi:TolB-like protein/Flp pilus assembly protein TadD